MKERAFAAAARALSAGEILGIFPEGKLTETGELNRFRPGVQQIVAMVPVARNLFAHRAGPPIPPDHATPAELEAAVLALRGNRR